MFSRINRLANAQRTPASAGATSSATTSRQTPAPSDERLEPLLSRHPEHEARTAVRNNNANKLQELLRERPQLLTQQFGDKEDTLLTEATRTGKDKAAQAILMQARLVGDSSSFSAFVNHRNADDRNALALAVEHNKPDLIQMLLKHGEVASDDPDLAMAIRQGHLDVAKSLVKNQPGSTRTTSTSEALSDASAAARRGDANKLQALLRQNPELLTEQFGQKNETLLTEAARAGKTGSVQAILIQAQITQAQLVQPSRFAVDIINHPNTDGNTALAQAIQCGHLDVATLLLTYKETDVTLDNERGQAPLHHAAKAENTEFAVRLLRHEGIRADRTDYDGNTPLHLAIDWRRSETAVKIAGHETAVPDKVNESSQNALSMAISSQDLLVIDTLLAHRDVEPDCTDVRGRTFLWQLLDGWQGKFSLGESGAPPPRWWCQILGKLAASPKVDSNRRHGPAGETPLTFLCKLSHPWNISPEPFNKWRNGAVQAMLEGSRHSGRLDPAATNEEGMTPYQVARQRKNESLAELFRAEARARGNPAPLERVGR
jgi:ankyrin repeat protein